MLLACLILPACGADPEVGTTTGSGVADAVDSQSGTLVDGSKGGGSDAGGSDAGGSDASGSDSADAKDAADTGLPATGSIAIYLKGELAKKTFIDGLSGQTPTNYQIALSRYEVLLSQDDPAPQPCFNLGNKAFVADLSKDNLVGYCATAKIKSGIYTHGRVKVQWSRYSVVGTLHYGGQVLPGTFTFLRAWSDTTVDGQAYKANTGTVTFAGVVSQVIPWTYPKAVSPPGFKFDLVGGELLFTFPYSKPLPIEQTSKEAHWARMHWAITDGFRWEEKKTVGFKSGVWDVAVPAAGSEQVKRFGVSGYKVTSSVDP